MAQPKMSKHREWESELAARVRTGLLSGKCLDSLDLHTVYSANVQNGGLSCQFFQWKTRFLKKYQLTQKKGAFDIYQPTDEVLSQRIRNNWEGFFDLKLHRSAGRYRTMKF